MKTKLLTLVAIAISCATFGQAPEAFKYQAVVRNAGGAIITNQSVGYQLTILQGSPSGTAVYTETFTPTSNSYGLVNLEIGTGTTVDDFSAIDWANGPYYIETAADLTGGTSYVVMGTSQLVSVPYALYAKSAENVTNDQVDDADADPTNEIQDISLTGTDLTITSGSTVDLSSLQDGTGTDDQQLTLAGTNLSIEDGNTVDLSVLQDGVNDADADPTNELQDISLTGTDLTITSGSTVDLSTVQDGTGTDDQNLTGATLTGTTLQIDIESGTSATVDLAGLQDGAGTDDQTLTLTGTDLSIESGNTVDLSTIQDGTGTDDQTLTLTGTDLSIESGNTVDLSVLQDGVTDADADPANELQTLGFAGTNLSISGGNTVDLSTLLDGTGTDDQTISLVGNNLSIETGNSVDLSGYLDNTDAQTLSVVGSNLTISNGNTVALPNDNDWTINGSDIHNANAGNVGIGTATPAGILDVTSTTSGVIMPRMTAAQRDAIGAPVNGMMVYNTDEDCMNVYQAGAWQSLCGGSGGGSGSNQDTLIYTTDGF